jgi:hypothetical protein
MNHLPGAESKIVPVTLSVRSEQQREALRKRVSEKAAAEGVQAVVIVHGRSCWAIPGSPDVDRRIMNPPVGEANTIEIRSSRAE